MAIGLKKYSKAGDLLIAAVHAHRQGKTEHAAKLFVKAADDEGLDDVLDTVDNMNEEAAKQTTAAAKPATKSAASSLARLMEEAKAKAKAKAKKKKVKAAEGDEEVAPAADEGDDSELDDLLMEESDGEPAADEANDDGLPEDDEVDVDSIIDSLDDEEDNGEAEVAPEVVDETMARVTARVARAKANLKKLP
jgi:hypothetical protein